MSSYEKKKIVTGKTFAKILGIVVGGFVGLFAIVLGIMYLCGAFDRPKVPPENIIFNISEDDLQEDSAGVSYYSPDILQKNEDGTYSVADYFYLDTKATNEDDSKVTEKEVSLSVSNNDVIKLESNTSKLGEKIKFIIAKNADGLPYGGFSTITIRSNSGINGIATLNVFIDIPVQKVDAVVEKTSKSNSSLFVNEVMKLKQPIFYPSKSLNPSNVSEGTQAIKKEDKQYVYKVEFKVKTAVGEGDTWIDIDSTDSLNTAQNRVVNWTDATKTAITAIKTGEFRVKVYAFDTYAEQEKTIASEQEAEKLERMRAVSEVYYYSITEVDYIGISSNNYDSTSVVGLGYKKTGIKVYLRTPKSASELASENAINLNLQINPNPNYGISAKDLYGKLKDIYITSNLQNQGNIIRIGGNEVENENGETIIYPYFNDSGEYEDESKKEYYYLIDVIGKQTSEFNLNFNIVNPNTKDILSLPIRTKVTETATTVFGFEKPKEMTNVGSYESLTMNIKEGVVTANLTIDTSNNDNYIDLTKFIVNKAENGQVPTYDKVRYYVKVGKTIDECNVNRQTIASIVKVDGFDYKEIIADVFCLEITDGKLIPLSYGSVEVYAVLIQTDINGDELIYSVTGTTTYKSASMAVNVDVKLKEVSLEVVTDTFDSLEDLELKENYSYNVIVRACINGDPTSNSLLVKNFANLSFSSSSNQVLIDNESGLSLNYNEQMDVYYFHISVPRLTETERTVIINCFLTVDGVKTNIGSTDEYSIKRTAVTRLTIKNASTEIKALWNGSSKTISWQDLTTGNTVNGDYYAVDVTIEGENQNYELETTNGSAISVVTRGGKPYLRLVKPCDDVVIIRATSSEDSTIFDTFQIKLVAESVIFNADPASKALGKNLRVDASGDVTENNVVFSEEVYKGDSINLFDRIGITCGNETNGEGLLSFEFETSVDCARFSAENPAVVEFYKNVAVKQDVIITVNSLFGQVMKYRFRVLNYISVEMLGSLPYNDSISTISGGKFQDRSVISVLDGKEYVTFVWSQAISGSDYNKINFASLLDIHSNSPTQTVQNLSYAIARTNNGRTLLNITSRGVISSNRMTTLQVTEPTIVYVEVSENYENEDGEIEKIFTKSFPILIVPNLKVSTGENENGNIVFNAGDYVFTENLQDKYSFTEIGDIQIDLKEIFVVSDFASNIIDVDTANFEIVNPTGNASISDNVLTINKNKVYANTQIAIKQSFIFNGATFSSEIMINVEPYYGIYVEQESGLLIDESKDMIAIYVGQNILLTDVISVRNDVSNSIENSITYTILQNDNTVIRIQEASSSNAKLIGTKYSAGKFAYIMLRINGEDTGFILKVKVVHDLGAYGVNNKYISSKEEPSKVNSNDKIYLTNIFTAKKLSNMEANVTLSYVISDEKVAYIDNNNRICFYPCAYAKVVTITASTGLEDVERLMVVFEVQPSQNMTISYKYAENDITSTNKSLYSSDEVAVGAFGYYELKPYDRINLKEYISATNTIDGVKEDIFSSLKFVVERYDFATSEWIATDLYSIIDLNKANPYIQPKDNYSDPVYTRIKVTSEGGLLGYFNVLLQTNASVNSEGNVIITMNYPNNSSNYYADNLTYECITQGTTIDLTATDSLNNRRIYAEFNRLNVTDSLVFSYKAYAMETVQSYTGKGIVIDGSNITIGSSVPLGTVIKVYMHNSYEEFTNSYNIYVGGNTVIKFKNLTVGTGEDAYNSSITYDANNSNNNVIALKDLFTITNLAGENISLKQGGSVTLSLENNANGSYVFAKIVNLNVSGENIPSSIAIDNYAKQGGQIVNILISVKDENGVSTSATYKLKVAPSVLSLVNTNGKANSKDNPYEVYGVANASKEYLLYKQSGSDATDLINLDAILSNAQKSVTYDLSAITVKSSNSAVKIVKESNKVAFVVNSTILVETDVVISLETVWGRVISYYVKLLPTNKLDVEENGAKVFKSYALTELDMFDESNATYVKFLMYDDSTGEYVIQNYDSRLIEIETYLNGNKIDMAKEDALVRLTNNGRLVFGSVRTDTVIDVKIYLSSEKGLAEKGSLQELKIVLIPNFNSADIVINVNGKENSITNPIHLTDNGFYLTDLMQIKRYVDSNISELRFPNGFSDVIKTFKFKGEILDISSNYKVTLKNSFASSTDKIASFDLTLNDDVTFKTFYVLVSANYAFEPVKDLTTVYEGASLNLSFISDYFIGSDGKKIVGGSLTFKVVEASDLFTLSNNVLTIKDNLSKEVKTKLIAIYKVEDRTYVGAVDMVLEPKHRIETKNEGINFVNSFDVTSGGYVINGETITKNDFIDLYFNIYKANLKVKSSSVSCSVTNKEINLNNETVYEVKVKIGLESESIYFKLTDNQTEYSYSKLDDRNVYIGGDAIALTNCVGQFINTATGEEIKANSTLDYKFMALDDGAIIASDGVVLNTNFSINEKVYKILVSMMAIDGNNYFAVINLVVYPSVTINLTYTQAGQSITIAKAGSEINLKDYIAFAPQRSGIRDYVLNNDTTSYEVIVFDTEGNKITSNLSSYFTLSGVGGGLTYEAISPKLSISLNADGYIFIVKASMRFNEGTISSYYYIKIDGISYAFNEKSAKQVLKENDTISLSMFGSFSIGNVTDVSFTAIGSYYEILNNKIVNTKNLYEKEVEILISAKYKDKDIFAVSKFNLDTRYIISNIINTEDEFVTSFEVLSTMKNINLLNANYINTNALKYVKNITINLFDTTGSLKMSNSYKYEGLDESNEYFSTKQGDNAVYFSPIDGKDLTNYYIVVQIEFNSLNQYKYIQYNLNFVDLPTGILVSNVDGSTTINLNANAPFDLNNVKVMYGSEQIYDGVSYVFDYQITNNYCYISNNKLYANPYYVDNTSKLTLTVRRATGEFVGQGYLTVQIEGIELNGNSETYQLNANGVAYDVDLQINGDKYIGSYVKNVINSKVFNKSGRVIQSETYLDYLELKNGKYYLKTDLFVKEDVVIELVSDIELKNSSNVTTDVKQFQRIIKISASKVELYINNVKVGDLSGEYTYKVKDLSKIKIAFKKGNIQYAVKLELATTDFTNIVSILDSTSEIQFNEIYSNATASVMATNDANNLRTVIHLEFPDFTGFNYNKDSNVIAVPLDEAFDNGDNLILIEAVSGNVVNNSTVKAYQVDSATGKCKVLKAGYIICVKNVAKQPNGRVLKINGKIIYSMKFFKTIEKIVNYDIRLDEKAISVVDLFTTDEEKRIKLNFVLNGVYLNAEYSITDTTDLSHTYLDYDITSNNELSYRYCNGNVGINTTKVIMLELCATYNNVTYKKQVVFNVRSPFETNSTYTYEFNLDAYKNYSKQKVLDLNNFVKSLTNDDVYAEFSYIDTMGLDNELLEVELGENAIYATVPSYSITYSGTGAVVASESGYTQAVVVECFRGDDTSIGTIRIVVKIKPINVSGSYSFSKSKSITLNYANLSSEGIKISSEINDKTASIKVNGEDLDVVTATQSISVSDLTDRTPAMFSGLYSASGSLNYSLVKSKINDRTKMFLMFSAKITINGEQTERIYAIPLTIKNAVEADAGQKLVSNAGNMDVLSTWEISSVSSKKLTTSEIKAQYPTLSDYTLTYDCIDIGYVVTNNEITLLPVQNAGLTYIKISAKKMNGSVIIDTKIFYLPIKRSVGSGVDLKYVVKDDLSIYDKLVNFSKDDSSQIKLIKSTLGLFDNANISVVKLAFTGNYLLFSVKVAPNDADMNQVNSYYLLEVRNSVYSYYVNYDVQFSGFDEKQIATTSLIHDARETIVSIVSDDASYLNVISFTNANSVIVIKPIFKDIVIPITIKTSIDGLYRYYNVNLAVQAVTKEYAKKAIFEIVMPSNNLIRGESTKLSTPNISAFSFEWRVDAGSDVKFDESTGTISTTVATQLQTICVSLLVSSLYGDYLFTQYMSIEDNSFEALYTQQIYTIYSGSNLDLTTIGKWNLKVNGNVLTDLRGYNVSYQFEKLSGNSGFVISKNILSTYYSIDDNVLKINCKIAVEGKGTFEKTIYITVQSGIEFIAGIYEVSQSSSLSLIANSVVSADLITGFTYRIKSSDVTDNSVVLTSTGKMQITNLASQGQKSFVVTATDGAGYSKDISFTLKIMTATKQFFEYTEPKNLSDETLRNTIQIKSGENRRFTMDIADIGEFKLASTTIGDLVYNEQILNNQTGYSFRLNYNGSLLTIVGRTTIYANEVLDATTVTVQVIVFDTANEYIGYMSIEILPKYEFRKVTDATVYEVEPNSTLIAGNLVSIYKDNTQIKDLASEGISMSFDFVGDSPKKFDNNSITFGYEDAGKLYRLKLMYEYNGEIREVHYIISVGVVTYNIEVKGDIYNIYSNQTIDLSKLEFNFFDKDGYKVDYNKSSLSFKAVEGSEEYYNLSGYYLTAKNTFEPIITSFYVCYNGYVGEVSLTINATYELALNKAFSVYAGKSSKLEYSITDIYRNIDVTDDETKFTYELSILGNQVGDLRAITISHMYANQTLSAVFKVYNADKSKLYITENVSISVLQSRFLKLVDSGLTFDDIITSSEGENLLDLIKVVDENGKEVSLSASDFTCELKVGDKAQFKQINDLIYRYDAKVDETITIIITDRLSGQSVEYNCMVNA